jgi:zinc-dependent metalloproteinase lipoprotein
MSNIKKMKINFTFACTFMMAFSVAAAQEIKLFESEPKLENKCFSAEYERQLRAKNAHAESVADFESWMKSRIIMRKNNPGQHDVTSYQLPIVFHVIYDAAGTGGAINIPASSIHAQIAQLNKDFSNLAGSPYSISASTGIQFCLAKTNPAGASMAEPGINRVERSSIGLGTPPYMPSSSVLENTMKPATIWDPTRYINVWVVAMGQYTGYSTFPSTSGLPGLDNYIETNTNAGVVINPSTVGSKTRPSAPCGTNSASSGGCILAHELGHFFGLRHIWGDANCGTDYCDDTPLHQTSNYGKFAHPKSNTCLPPTADEMFENYMDYTDDEQLNTFTNGQVARMQTVMLNSPRRASLATSNVLKECISSNTISFYPCNGAVVKETANAGSCPRYRILPVLLNIEDRSNAAATVNITATGTATNGVDYIIDNPVINFAAGEGNKYVNLRIIDDGVPEGNETVNLSYTISGTGVKAGSASQLFSVTITDDDSLAISQNKIILLENDFSVGTPGWGIASTPNNPNTWTRGADADNTFGSSFLYITNNAAATPKPYAYSASTSGATVILTPLLNTIGLKTLSLDLRYAIQGVVAGNTARDYARIMYSFPGNQLSFVSTPYLLYNTPTPTVVSNLSLAPLLDSSKFYMSFYFANGVGTPANPSFGLDDIKISGMGTTIETQLGHIRSLNVLAGKTNHFVSQNDDQLIASMSAVSADIECLSATVQQAGSSKVDIVTNAGTFKRSEKVVKMTSSAAGNASYNMTLYFTQEELAAWSADERANLKVMKVADNIGLDAVITQAEIITPVYGDSVAKGKGFCTYSFNSSGFSQFFLVEPNTALPIRLLSFTVKAAANSILLNWNTSNETGNRGFDIERSTDGTHFSKIAFVQGKGQGNQPANFGYDLKDERVQAGITYYYRLKQVDIDGRFEYSSIKSARIGERNIVTLSPNPVKSVTRLISTKNIIADIQLVDAKGSVVQQWQRQNIGPGGFEINMSMWPAGIYLLRVTDNEGSMSYKLVKE